MADSPRARRSERANACRALEQVVRFDRTIDWVMVEKPLWMNSPFTRDLVYGCLRHYFALEKIIGRHLDRPLRTQDSDVKCLLLVGAYQLMYSEVPDYAVINETVASCRDLKKPWARALVNAVLRGITRARVEDDGSFDRDTEVPGPTWLVQKIDQLYAQPHLLQTLIARAPMTLRINTGRTSVESYRTQLTSQSIEFQTTCLPEAISLAAAQPAHTLPGWQEGHVAVQDLGAMLVSRLFYQLIAPAADAAACAATILDACCAPGGKLFHLLELAQRDHTMLRVQGLDNKAKRLDVTRTLGRRLGHDVTLAQGDASTGEWWRGELFSHILLDAPCSGSGTLRRNPDIKLLLRERALVQLQETQLKLLNNLWRMLDSPGSLMYCTCSILEEENDQVIRQFLADNRTPSNTPDVVGIDLPTGHATEFGWQLLPTDPLTDGFYIAILEKGATRVGGPHTRRLAL